MLTVEEVSALSVIAYDQLVFVGLFCPLFLASIYRVDYYPTVVFITTNKLAQVVMGNFLLVIAVAFAKMIRAIFLGPLRDIEVEVRRC